MPVSSSTLFHFTPKRSTLFSILENGFWPSYGHESFGFDENSVFSDFYIPSVCFCDIPLSLIKNHTEVYGKYAIGLTKEWGKQNGLNPVIYAHQNSELFKKLESSFLYYEKFLLKEAPKKRTKEYNELSDFIMEAIDIIKYLKPLDGTFKHGSKVRYDYNYYDEREWRYCLKFSDDIEDVLFTEDSLKKNAPKTRDYPLKFTANDVNYIIINNDEEVEGVINNLTKIFGNTITQQELHILFTKIETWNRIAANT